jgi:hypothetical protein
MRDYRLKTQQKFERPYFSPITGSYEIDHWFASDTNKIGDVSLSNKHVQIYFTCININTRYLFMFPVARKAMKDTLECIKEIHKITPIKSIRSDTAVEYGTITNRNADFRLESKPMHVKPKPKPYERFFTAPRPPREERDPKNPLYLGTYTYVNNPMSKFLFDNGIRFYTAPSSHLNRNRIVDRAIRTIRDKIGENFMLAMDPNIVAQAVREYNHTPHSAFNHRFTPAQVQNNVDLEEYFIRERMYELEHVKELQRKEGLLDYKPGNILVIHFGEKNMGKVRRTFNRLAVFVRYDFGNVVCKVLGSEATTIDVNLPDVPPNTITIPIQFTKYLAPSRDDIPKEYHKLMF